MTCNTGPILVFPWIQPFKSVDLSSRGNVYSRHVTGSAICKNSSVCFVMRYCPTSTVFRNLASVQISFTQSCCGSFSTRPLCFCNRFSWARISIEVCGCHYEQVCWREKWIRLLCHNRSSCSCSTATVCFTQIWDCSVVTELIDRNDGAKNSFNRITIGTEVYR